MSMPVASLMRSTERCVVVPVPEEAYDSFSLRASAISSCRFFAGTDGWTAIRFGVLGPRITGVKSLTS